VVITINDNSVKRTCIWQPYMVINYRGHFTIWTFYGTPSIIIYRTPLNPVWSKLLYSNKFMECIDSTPLIKWISLDLVLNMFKYSYYIHSKLNMRIFFFQNERTYTLKCVYICIDKCICGPNLTKTVSVNSTKR
jgi:hypothetical protein